MHPKNIHIKDYTYELPENRIAKHPLELRDQSKLLIYRERQITEGKFSDISEILPPETTLVFNNTKVIHARLQFNRETGAAIEILCLEPFGHMEMQSALSSKGSSMWKAMVGNAKRWKQGEKLVSEIPFSDGTIALTATLLNKLDDTYIVGFFWEPFSLSFAEVLHHAGTLPLPPYLNRENIPEDEERYQTIYAIHNGSVAAPTAGLHFTFDTLDKLATRKIEIADITLHVGAGTFKPVKSGELEQHAMHEEIITVSKETILLLRKSLVDQTPLAAVGTTVTRTLESLFWHAVKRLQNSRYQSLNIHQWDPYELDPGSLSPVEALDIILKDMEDSGTNHLTGSTAVMIAPGYTFRFVNILITNFHQPESTLILLIAAFAGEDWKQIYDYALSHDFRFLSYGDSSVMFR